MLCGCGQSWGHRTSIFLVGRKRGYDMVHKLMLPVHVIGIGAGGSRTVRHLVSERTHIAGPLHICDGDSVEEKNCKNQLYQPSHVGMRKVHALAEQVRAWREGDVVPVLRPEYFTPGEPLRSEEHTSELQSQS